jgi:hypothetical protein
MNVGILFLIFKVDWKKDKLSLIYIIEFINSKNFKQKDKTFFWFYVYLTIGIYHVFEAILVFIILSLLLFNRSAAWNLRSLRSN